MDFSGVFTAIVTPFKKGNIDLETLLSLIENQIKAGIKGVVLSGTTGESPTLSGIEKNYIFKEVVKKYKGKLIIVAGAGGNNTTASIEAAESARECGVDAILSVTPYYNKPSQQGLYCHFKEVAVKAKIPVILYNVPGRTGVNIAPDTVDRLCEIKNIVAIKEAGTFSQMNDMIGKVGKKIKILSGDDNTFMPFMALGGHGVISVVSNIIPEKMVELYKSVIEDNLQRAREIHFEIYPLIEVLFIEANPMPVKAAMNLLGLISEEIRLPLVRPSEESIKKIKLVMKSLQMVN